MAAFTDIELMNRAMTLAQKGRGKTLPNPMVGAVIVKNGNVVGEGYHRGPGKPHAEVEAIKRAGRTSRGSTLYVNLEPCCHTGRTGPCTEAIAAAGIRKVIYAITDPYPPVNGKGAGELRKAGVEVSNGILSKEAARLNDVYFGLVKNQRPYVILKLAQSLDGRIATENGESKWISSEKSRKFVHELRAESDAVLIGAGTLRKDNPELTTRLVRGKNPYRIIVTGTMDLPEESYLIKQNNDLKTIIATCAERKTGKLNFSSKLTYWKVNKDSANRIDISDLLSKAKDFGLNSILVEGGAQIATSFLKAKLVDKLIFVTAPVIIGQGKDSIGELGISNISDAIKFKDFYRIDMEPDNILVGYPDWSK